MLSPFAIKVIQTFYPASRPMSKKKKATQKNKHKAVQLVCMKCVSFFFHRFTSSEASFPLAYIATMVRWASCLLLMVHRFISIKQQDTSTVD